MGTRMRDDATCSFCGAVLVADEAGHLKECKCGFSEYRDAWDDVVGTNGSRLHETDIDLEGMIHSEEERD